MKPKISQNRTITVPFRLITQSNDFRFVRSNFLKDTDWNDFLREKKYKGPVKTFDVDEYGNLHDPIKRMPKYNDPRTKKIFEETWKEENNYKTIQKITIYDVNEKGVYYGKGDLEEFPEKLYPKLAKNYNDMEFSNFIRENFDFCDFATNNDRWIIKEDDSNLFKFVLTEKDKTRAANWHQLNNKYVDFGYIIENITNNKLTQGDLDFLITEIRENVVEILIDRNSPAYKELENEEVKFENNFLNHFKPVIINDIYPVIGYKIYGHFALCCLELYLDLKKGAFPRFCQNPLCRKILSENLHGNQKFCSEKDNPECHKQWRKEARKIERRNLKIRKRKTAKPKIKRNLK